MWFRYSELYSNLYFEILHYQGKVTNLFNLLLCIKTKIILLFVFKFIFNFFVEEARLSDLLFWCFDTIKTHFVYKLPKKPPEYRLQLNYGIVNFKLLPSPLLANKILFAVLINTNQQLVKPGVQFWEGKVGWVVDSSFCARIPSRSVKM